MEAPVNDEMADASQDDHLAENTDNTPDELDGVQDLVQAPIAEADVEVSE